MKFEIDETDVKVIAEAVAQKLMPQLQHLKSGESDDSIMGVPELAAYLGMSDKWIYDQTGGNRIPFFKLGNILKFRKKEIDKWMRAFEAPAVERPTAMMKLVRR